MFLIKKTYIFTESIKSSFRHSKLWKIMVLLCFL